MKTGGHPHLAEPFNSSHIVIIQSVDAIVPTPDSTGMHRPYSEILRTLLYYDIWHHPLTARELFAFLPVNSMTFPEFEKLLTSIPQSARIRHHDGFYFVEGKTEAVVRQRQEKERHADRLWRMARRAGRLIRRFPFVRGVYVSGDLSKNVATGTSDIDFFIITAPGRLWITRSALILFKKVFLLNSRKFFCINYLTSSDNLAFDDRNVFTATEIATLKPLYGRALFDDYLLANSWIKKFFPNIDMTRQENANGNERPSNIQRMLESIFDLVDADALDVRLMNIMRDHWAKSYPDYDEATRQKIFRCTRMESRAYIGNFQEKILALYEHRLREFNVHPRQETQ